MNVMDGQTDGQTDRQTDRRVFIDLLAAGKNVTWLAKRSARQAVIPTKIKTLTCNATGTAWAGYIHTRNCKHARKSPACVLLRVWQIWRGIARNFQSCLYVLFIYGQKAHIKYPYEIKLLSLNKLRSRPNDLHFADNIFKWIFLYVNVSIVIQMSLKYVPKGSD